MNIKKTTITIITAIAILGFTAVSVFAAYSLFDDASIVSGGNPGNAAQAVSDASPGWGGVDFDDANGTTFASLTHLSADVNVTDDNCGGGSPRFSISVDTNGDNIHDGNIFIYFGDVPNFNTCTPNTWVNTGELIGATDTRFDLTQLGGPFYGTYTDTTSLVGSATILGISLVADGGWNSVASGDDGEQTILFDNVVINNATYDFKPTPTPTPTVTPTPGPFAIPAECSGIEGLGAPIIGTNRPDQINGTSGNDLIFALGGPDSVDGKGGNDCIVGGDGPDSLKGGSNNDVILGGNGADSIDGGNNNDQLYGENGADSIKGGSGNDSLFGGDGADSLKGEAGTDTLDGGNQMDSANGGGGTDTCTAESETQCEI